MTDINFYIDTFNNREKAIIVWLVIFLVWALLQKNVRSSFLGVLKALFQKKILTVLVAMLLYVGLVVFIFYKIQFWDVFLVKDTVFWILGVAFILLMNANKATQDKHYFRKILLDNLKLILVLEFIINLYTFNLWIELILVPLLFLIVAMGAVAEFKKEYMPVKKIIDSILSFFGILLIIFALFKIFGDYRGFATTDNLRSFLLPLLLMLAYLPFLYLFTLLMAYENLFVRLDIFLKENKTLANFAKRKIFRLCFFDLGKLNRFAKESTSNLLNLKDKNDILSLVQKFRNQKN